MKNINFKKYICKFSVKKYQSSDRFAIMLTSAVSDLKNDLFEGEPIATATVNMPEVELESNQIIIKDYSENIGMTKALEEAGLITINSNAKEFQLGDGRCVIADMSDELLAHIENDPTLKIKPKKNKL